MKVINVKTSVERQLSDFVYIGRPSAFGNPFLIGRDGDRAKVIERFEVYARSNPPLLAKIRALTAETTLGCYCTPQACHGDVIVKLWREMHA